MCDNTIVVDLNKVQFAKMRYRNQHGDISKKAHKHSYRGYPYDPKEIAYGHSITMEDYAVMRGIKDVWTPICTLQLTANHSLKYTGDKAKSIWREWNRRIFKKGKQ